MSVLVVLSSSMSASGFWRRRAELAPLCPPPPYPSLRRLFVVPERNDLDVVGQAFRERPSVPFSGARAGEVQHACFDDAHVVSLSADVFARDPLCGCARLQTDSRAAGAFHQAAMSARRCRLPLRVSWGSTRFKRRRKRTINERRKDTAARFGSRRRRLHQRRGLLDP